MKKILRVGVFIITVCLFVACTKSGGISTTDNNNSTNFKWKVLGDTVFHRDSMDGSYKFGAGLYDFSKISPMAICLDPKSNFYTISSNDYIRKWSDFQDGWTSPYSIISNRIGLNTCWPLSFVSDANSNLYFAGHLNEYQNFSNSDYVVLKWDGNTWGWLGAYNSTYYPTTLLAGKNGYIYLLSYSRNSYGSYYVAVWQSQYNSSGNWVELGGADNSMFNGAINAIAQDASGNIYIGGDFVNKFGNTYVAKWNGSSWIELGANSDSIFNGSIQTIAIDKNNNVFVGGSFTNANGSYYVAKWNGNWGEVGGRNKSNFNPHQKDSQGGITVIATDVSNNLYIGGWFVNASGNYYIAKWNGSNWGELGGINSAPFSQAGTIGGAIIQIVIDKEGQVYTSGDYFLPNSKRFVGNYFTYAARYGN